MPKRSISAYVDVDIADVLEQMDDEYLRDECERRGIKVTQEPKARTNARYADACDQIEYEIDTLLHDLRTAFLGRDQSHFDVLLARIEGRYRDVLTETLARERVA